MRTFFLKNTIQVYEQKRFIFLRYSLIKYHSSLIIQHGMSHFKVWYVFDIVSKNVTFQSLVFLWYSELECDISKFCVSLSFCSLFQVTFLINIEAWFNAIFFTLYYCADRIDAAKGFVWNINFLVVLKKKWTIFEGNANSGLTRRNNSV